MPGRTTSSPQQSRAAPTGRRGMVTSKDQREHLIHGALFVTMCSDLSDYNVRGFFLRKKKLKVCPPHDYEFFTLFVFHCFCSIKNKVVISIMMQFPIPNNETSKLVSNCFFTYQS